MKFDPVPRDHRSKSVMPVVPSKDAERPDTQMPASQWMVYRCAGVVRKDVGHVAV
jgi:hypothetical protein